MRPRLALVLLLTIPACDDGSGASASETGGSTGSSGTQPDAATTLEGSSTSGEESESTGAVGETGSTEEPPPPSMFDPSNVPGSDDSACHVVGEELPQSFLRATCVGASIPMVESASDFCDDGPKPFGTMVQDPGALDIPLFYACAIDDGSPEALFFGSGPDAMLALARRTDGGEVQVEGIGVSVSAASWVVNCTSVDGETTQSGQDEPLPVGEVGCGSITVVEANPGQPPVVAVEFEGETVYLQLSPQ